MNTLLEEIVNNPYVSYDLIKPERISSPEQKALKIRHWLSQGVDFLSEDRNKELVDTLIDLLKETGNAALVCAIRGARDQAQSLGKPFRLVDDWEGLPETWLTIDNTCGLGVSIVFSHDPLNRKEMSKLDPTS